MLIYSKSMRILVCVFVICIADISIAAEPSTTEPSATEPSATEPSATEPSATGPSAIIVVTDLRTGKQKAARRDSVFSPISFLPDKAVKPLPAEKLKLALIKHSTSLQPLQLTIQELRVIDYFPHRINSTSAYNPVFGSLVDSKTDWTFVNEMKLPTDTDSIVCVFVGTLNGVDIKVSVFNSYKLPMTAMLVRKNSNFIEAVDMSIDQIAQKILSVGIATKNTKP